MNNNELNYNGYTGSIEISIEDNCLHGRILFIDDIVTYEGETVAEITIAFNESVDRYILYCKETGKLPNKPYSGTTNVRIGQERHRALAQQAFREKTSINELLCQAVDLLLSNKIITEVVAAHHEQTTPVIIGEASGQMNVKAIFGTGSGQQQINSKSENSNVIYLRASASGIPKGVR